MLARYGIKLDPWTLRGVLVITGLFGLANALIRLTAGRNLAFDDTKENIFTQSFQWGYLPDNPPLYEWTLSLVQQTTGPGLYSFLIVKYALMLFSAGFLFLVGRRIFADQKWAALTVYSSILLYQVGFNYHQAFTHSLMLIAAVSFSLWTFIRLLQEQRWLDYALFGFSIGLGLLSKYNFAGYLIVLLGAGVLTAENRRSVLTPKLLISILIPAVMILPHLFWLQDNQRLLSQYIGHKLIPAEISWASRVTEGLGDTVVAFISFYLPLLLVAYFCFRPAFSATEFLATRSPTLIKVMGRTLLLAAALVITGVLLFGISNVTERYVIPLLLPSYLWVMWYLLDHGSNERNRLWAFCLAAGCGLIILIRFITVFSAGEPVCDDCQRWRPYAAIAERIEEEGLDPAAVYIGYEENTAGNLRRLLPQAYVRSFNLLFYNPIREATDRPCYFIWSEELLGQPVESKLRHITDDERTLIVRGEWKHPLRKTGWRVTTWGISPIDPEDRFYKSLCTS